VIAAAVTEVGRLLNLHPTYAVKVTGHSLGAAMAQLAAMDLVKAGFPATLYNFGQPRVGDQAYAAFSTGKLKTFRVVHNKDDVPHMPITTGMEFYHACTEVFEDVSGTVRVCSTSNCEDPTCSDKFKASELNGDDHMVYLGYPISCETVS
jgi:predicted lipase